ncbi:hypothetical protein ACHAO1_002643 [Botrytis cinerea]
MSKFVVSNTAQYGTNFYPIAFEDGFYTTFTLEIHGKEGGPDFYEHGPEMYMISLESWELWHNLDQVIEDTIHHHRSDLSAKLLHLVAVKRAEKTGTKKKTQNQMSGSSGEKKGQKKGQKKPHRNKKRLKGRCEVIAQVDENSDE